MEQWLIIACAFILGATLGIACTGYASVIHLDALRLRIQQQRVTIQYLERGLLRNQPTCKHVWHLLPPGDATSGLVCIHCGETQER